MSAGCRIASCRPLIVPPSRHLVAPAGCRIASCRPLVVPPSHSLIAPACCRITSPYPLVAPRAALSSSRHTGWLLHCLLMRRPLVVSSCRLSLSCCASWLSHHHLSLSFHCTALSSSHRAGRLLRCLCLRRPLVLLSWSNANAIKRRQKTRLGMLDKQLDIVIKFFSLNFGQ